MGTPLEDLDRGAADAPQQLVQLATTAMAAILQRTEGMGLSDMDRSVVQSAARMAAVRLITLQPFLERLLPPPLDGRMRRLAQGDVERLCGLVYLSFVSVLFAADLRDRHASRLLSYAGSVFGVPRATCEEFRAAGLARRPGASRGGDGYVSPLCQGFADAFLGTGPGTAEYRPRLDLFVLQSFNEVVRELIDASGHITDLESAPKGGCGQVVLLLVALGAAAGSALLLL